MVRQKFANSIDVGMHRCNSVLVSRRSKRSGPPTAIAFVGVAPPLGISLVEVLVVTGIVSGLLGILIPAVLSARQQAQSRDCVERIRQLSIAVHGYEAARQHLPPGILGFDRVIDFDNEWFNPSSSFHWKRAQFTSWLALTLPYLDGGADEVLDYDPIAFNERVLLGDLTDSAGLPRYDGFATIPGFGALAARRLSEFRCPADRHLERSEELYYVFGAIQVCTTANVPNDRRLTWRPLLEDPSGEFGLTNYAGCVGSNSGGVVPGDTEGNARRGMMTYRYGLPLARVRDGLSHTILLGETIGEVGNGVRLAAQNWLVAGLAHGDGAEYESEYPMLGNANLSFWKRFGSAHPAGVWVSFGDGHAQCVNREIDRTFFERLCGIADLFD